MKGKYIEQLKEKSDEVFKETTSKISFGQVINNPNGTVEVSPDNYVTDFNFWVSDFLSFNHLANPIFQGAILNVSTITESSLFLVLHGYYRSAISELRTALDDFLTRIYFDILNNQDKLKDSYNNWLLGKEYIHPLKPTEKKVSYPAFKEILELIFQEKFIKLYDDEFCLKKEIMEFYAELSKYTHNRPDETYKKEDNTKSSLFNIRFALEDFNKWKEYIKKLYNLVSTLILLLYPDFIKSKYGSPKTFQRYEPELFKKINDKIKKIEELG